MESAGKFMVALGVGLVLIGLWMWLAPNSFRLFRLPGDIVIQRDGFTFAFPIVSMLLISGVLTLASLAFRFFQR